MKRSIRPKTELEQARNELLEQAQNEFNLARSNLQAARDSAMSDEERELINTIKTCQSRLRLIRRLTVLKTEVERIERFLSESRIIEVSPLPVQEVAVGFES